MDGDVVLPNLGFGMEEGRLIAWLKQPGDAVKRGEPIAEIESDKATVELEALVDGVLQDVLVAPDSVVPVGAADGRRAGRQSLQRAGNRPWRTSHAQRRAERGTGGFRAGVRRSRAAYHGCARCPQAGPRPRG